MNGDACERELEVMAAIDADIWPADLVAHVASCGPCQQVQAVGGALLGYLREESELPLPDASSLWWRARLDARREARRRSMLPLDTVERAEPFVAVAALVLVLALRGDMILGALASWATGGAGLSAVQMAMPGIVMPVLIGGVVVTALMLLVALGAVFSRD